MRIATLPIGYADGLWRSNYPNNAVMEINGKYAPIVGRICMDQCMIDVSDIPDAEIGSRVIVYGCSEKNSITQIAASNETVGYEILCTIGERVPRIYIENNAIIGIQDNIVKGDI
jgi:alanine racemase